MEWASHVVLERLSNRAGHPAVRESQSHLDDNKALHRLAPLFPAACLYPAKGSTEGSWSSLRGMGGEGEKKL